LQLFHQQGRQASLEVRPVRALRVLVEPQAAQASVEQQVSVEQQASVEPRAGAF